MEVFQELKAEIEAEERAGERSEDGAGNEEQPPDLQEASEADSADEMGIASSEDEAASDGEILD
eukprot:6593899-Karenia_brevis.AAC.1